jgi:hypothetical protein
MKTPLIIGIIAIKALFLSSIVFAETYTMRSPTVDKLTSWGYADPIYSDWVAVGGHYNCQAWNPDEGSVGNGQTYVKSRTCSQNQSRTGTSREYDSFSQAYRVIAQTNETRTIEEQESANAVGSMEEWATHTSTYTEWTDTQEAPLNVSAWLPAITNQTAGFTQNRNYDQQQVRYEQQRRRGIYTSVIENIGSPIAQYQNVGRSESRALTVEITNTTNVGQPVCGAWTPAVTTINQGQTFTQTAACTQSVSNERTFYANGVAVQTTNTAGSTGVNSTRQAVGTFVNPCHFYKSDSRMDAGWGSATYYDRNTQIWWWQGEAIDGGTTNAVFVNGKVYTRGAYVQVPGYNSLDYQEICRNE